MSILSRYWWVDSADEQGFIDFFQKYRQQPSAQDLAAMRAQQQAMRMQAQQNSVEAKDKPMRYYQRNSSASYYAEYMPLHSEGDDDTGAVVSDAGIGILHLRGYLTKDDGFYNWVTGNPSISSVIADLNLMADDPAVKGVAIYVDSGGGEVRGIEELANTIRGYYARCKKRVQAYVDGTAASAAYWSVSGADRIVLVGNASTVGSIGTMVTVVDMTGYEKQLGIVARNIYATLSTDKNRAFEQAKVGNDEPMRAMLDKYNSVFIGDVIRGRYRNTYRVEDFTPENVPEQFKGGMYFGRDAVTVGLADGVAPTKNDALGAFIFLLENNLAVQAGMKRKEYEGGVDDMNDDMDDDNDTEEPYDSVLKRSMQYRKQRSNGKKVTMQDSTIASAEAASDAQPQQQGGLIFTPLRSFTL